MRGEAPSRSSGEWRTGMQSVLAEVRAGAEIVQTGRWTLPPLESRVRRFMYGLAIPFALIRVALAEPKRRRAYLRGVIPAMVATLAIGGLFATEAVERVWRKAYHEPNPAFAVGAVEGAVEGLIEDAPVKRRRGAAAVPTRATEPADELANRIAADVEDAVESARSKVPDPAPPRGLLLFWALITAIYGSIKVIEWIVVAFTRDYQDLLQRNVSLASGVPPEDPELRPRVRLDLRWVQRKLWRKLRGAMLLLWGMIPLALFTLLPQGKALYSVAAFLWTVYWWAVFSLARTRYAWDHGVKVDPFYLRGADAVGRFVLAAPVRAYARFWRRRSESVLPACATFERASWEGLGLAFARFVLDLPVVYIFFRPVLAVAAQHVSLGRVETWQQQPVVEALPTPALVPVAISEAKLTG